jgi:hypothetical protein
MLEHITDLLLTCLSIFSHVFPGFVTAISSPSESEIPAALAKSRCPPSNTPSPNWVTPVSQQLRAPANQQDRSPSLEIIGHVWTLPLARNQSAWSSIIFTGHSLDWKPPSSIYAISTDVRIYVWIMVRPRNRRIERWPFWIGRSDTISSTLWMLDGSSPTRSALR